MDGAVWVALIPAFVVGLAPVVLMGLRIRRIKRYGAAGGESNPPFTITGYNSGMPSGTVIQQTFGPEATSQAVAATPSFLPSAEPRTYRSRGKRRVPLVRRTPPTADPTNTSDRPDD